MTGVVLARGVGRRMREPAAAVTLSPAQFEAASAGRKPMMPVGAGPGSRPFLDYVLSSLADAGCDRACLVVAPGQSDVRRRYLAEVRPSRLAVAFVEQAVASGTAHAVLAAESSVGDGPFLVVNGDNLYPVAVLRDLIALAGPGVAAFSRDDLTATGDVPADRIADFALIEVDDHGWLRRVVEKPGPSAVAGLGPDPRVSMNAWRFDRRMFAACRDVARSARGEYELPDAVTLALTRGVRFRAVAARGPVLDLSRQGDIPRVTERLSGLEVDL